MPPLTCARIVVGTTLSWSASLRIVNPSGPAESHSLTAASTIFARVIPALWPALRFVGFLKISATPPPMTKAARPAPARAIAHWIIQLSTPVFRAPIHAARVSIGAKPLGCGLGQVLSGRAPFLADVAACRGIVMSDEFWLSIARGAHGR